MAGVLKKAWHSQLPKQTVERATTPSACVHVCIFVVAPSTPVESAFAFSAA